MYRKRFESDVQDLTRSVEPVWREVVNPETGEKELRLVGETNVDVRIQKEAEGVALSAVIAKGLPPVQDSQFRDISQLPNGLVEAVETVKKARLAAEDAYLRLPDDLRASFQNIEDFENRYTPQFLEEYLKKKSKEMEKKKEEEKI